MGNSDKKLPARGNFNETLQLYHFANSPKENVFCVCTYFHNGVRQNWRKNEQFGEVQMCANIVELKMLKNKPTLAAEASIQPSRSLRNTCTGKLTSRSGSKKKTFPPLQAQQHAMEKILHVSKSPRSSYSKDHTDGRRPPADLPRNGQCQIARDETYFMRVMVKRHGILTEVCKIQKNIFLKFWKTTSRITITKQNKSRDLGSKFPALFGKKAAALISPAMAIEFVAT